MSLDRSFLLSGIFFVFLGIALIVIPVIARYIPEIDLEKVPWFLLYVYQRDGFIFATSPILILIGVVCFVWSLFHR